MIPRVRWWTRAFLSYRRREVERYSGLGSAMLASLFAVRAVRKETGRNVSREEQCRRDRRNDERSGISFLSSPPLLCQPLQHLWVIAFFCCLQQDKGWQRNKAKTAVYPLTHLEKERRFVISVNQPVSRWGGTGTGWSKGLGNTVRNDLRW